MARDPETLAHLEWLGYVQPVGLVVSIPALLDAQVHVGRISPTEHQAFLACLFRDKDNEIIPEIPNLGRFVQSVLSWEASDLREPPESFGAFLPEYEEPLRPTFVVPDPQPKLPDRPWLMLVECLPKSTDLDETNVQDGHHWQVTPQTRFERLLCETEVSIGLLFNHTQLRLVYAPRGETSGYATFNVSDMATVAGRPIFAALVMLLHQDRLFRGSDKERLPAILVASRKYQNVVSTQLAEQVLASLYELLRGFQAADDVLKGKLLHDILAKDPNHVYAGLLTVLMRLVFILYAEDRGLLSTDSIYVNYYSVTGLFDRLRADAGRFPDTMNHRYGAWAQLLSLFRLVYEGGSHAGFHIPAHKGYLFDPTRYPFLEGRSISSAPAEGFSIPHVSDGVLFHVLSNLLVLDGERLSYRTLDVEQIGSVYETIMGFNLEVAQGRSIAIKPTKPHGVPSTINLEGLLQAKSAERAKWLLEQSDQKLMGQVLEGLKNAKSIDDLLVALDKKIARNVTPNVVSKGAMVLQPSDERRRSGSHYTPRSLTEPIVRKTLEPILKQLGPSPTPKQILDLKVCDPAMGSGAFLVEACRQLGDVLVKAWHLHKQMPKLPLDEDEVLHARRLVAQRCLYGVDKNVMAVDLSKLSLWLATLARDHPFTFLDHALRHGDSLVGLTRKQIADFHWLPTPQRSFGQEIIEERIQLATRARQEIIEAGDEVPFLLKAQKLASAEESVNRVRFVGNLVIAAFFAGENDKQRKLKRDELLQEYTEYLRTGNMTLRPTKAEQELRSGDKAIHPFHWEIEFPEVFGRENGGFDAMVGNPPFAGKNTLVAGNREGYPEWLKALHAESHGNSDLVAHFFRRAFNVSRLGGACGLIATKTIGQGDTRNTGLRWICTHDGVVFAARKRLRWPGAAAVVVSVVNFCKGQIKPSFDLDGRAANEITAYLFHAGGHDDPERLIANDGKSFIGHFISGSGFTFDDTDRSGASSSLEEMNRVIQKSPRNQDRVFDYIGGEEVLNHPQQHPHRYVINFEDFSEAKARQWPDLIEIIERKVKPERENLPPKNAWNRTIAKRWWLFGAYRSELREKTAGLKRVLFHPNLSANLAFAFLPASILVGAPHNVLAFDDFVAFALLQSRIHEGWARFFGSTFKDDLRYTPSDCFETFPFPENFETDANLEAVGKDYYEFRAALMVKNNEGLTKTYNRFHDPLETSADIQKLRELHAAMDRAVLDAYHWTDLQPTCEFLLDYEEEEPDEETGSARRKTKPWRYRWPDEFRDEVLARLLELNKVRAEQERLSGEAAEAATKKTVKRARKTTPAKDNEKRLPGM